MTPESFQKIAPLFDAALKLEPSRREAFLDEACGGDSALRQEIESLLASHDEAQGFMDAPAMEVAAKAIAGSRQPRSMRFAPGLRVGRYEVLSVIGAGGMGEIYLAHDTQLDRKVAIKVLTPEFLVHDSARKRLIREARAAAKLDHPNICSIYEVVDEESYSFIVMQYIEGSTLASRIADKNIQPREALDIAMQAADALAEAHAGGLIHRDIKPQNIMITPRGQVKVLDFGLAKSVAAEDADATKHSLTEEGAVAGTIPYMSPEQLKAQDLDVRTDLFSLGVVLYEMLTGNHPFAAASRAETVSAILTREPPAVTPGSLDKVVRKALQKQKEQRYASAKELIADLRGLERQPDVPQRFSKGAVAIVVGLLMILAAAIGGYRMMGGRPKAIESIAVLPFVNVTGDSDNEYLSDGISDSIISNLSQISELRVISLSSVLRYKGQQIDPQQVGRELKVQALLMGRLIHRGDELSISTELVDINDSRRIWGEQYNRKLSDLLQVQSDISRQISERLRPRLSGEDQKQLAKVHTTNSDAYHLYLQGRFYWNKYSESGFKKSIEYYDQAVQRDPNYALAYAGIADSYVQLGIDFLAGDAAPKARENATKALQLDDSLAEAHMSLAEVKLFYDWDWPLAEREFKRAIELNPNYPDTYHFYGHYLETVGRVDEAIQTTKQGLQLDPNSLVLNSELGWAYYFARQDDEAVRQLLRTLELNPHFGIAHQYLGRQYALAGKHNDATEEFKKAIADIGDWPDIFIDMGYNYALSGNAVETQKVIQRLQGMISQGGDPYLLAPIYLVLGEKEKSFAALEKAYEKRSFWLPFIKVERRFDNVRSDSRFVDLVRRIGIP